MAKYMSNEIKAKILIDSLNVLVISATVYLVYTDKLKYLTLLKSNLISVFVLFTFAFSLGMLLRKPFTYLAASAFKKFKKKRKRKNRSVIEEGEL